MTLTRENLMHTDPSHAYLTRIDPTLAIGFSQVTLESSADMSLTLNFTYHRNGGLKYKYMTETDATFKVIEALDAAARSLSSRMRGGDFNSIRASQIGLLSMAPKLISSVAGYFTAIRALYAHSPLLLGVGHGINIIVLRTSALDGNTTTEVLHDETIYASTK